jgi:hypothetical protein
MDISKQLSNISLRLLELTEEIEVIMNNTSNTELYLELDENVKIPLETIQTQIDITIDEISDGMYEEIPFEEEGEEWD